MQEAAAARLREFVREVAPGQCKKLSQGNDCECPLCDIDRLVLAAEESYKIGERSGMSRARSYPGHGDMGG